MTERRPSERWQARSVGRQVQQSAWTAESVGARQQWSIDLRAWCDPAALCGSEPASDEVDTRDAVGPGHVPPWFAELARVIGGRLRDGPGFVVVRGFPVEVGGRRRVTRLFAWLMSRLGRVLPQNTVGDEIYLVRTTGAGSDRQYGSRGSGELLFHTDQAAAPPRLLPEVMGLLGLGRAASGGSTRLVSGHALVNALGDLDRSLIDAMLVDVPFGRVPDGVSDAQPLLAPMLQPGAGGGARLRYNRHFTEVGAEQMDRCLPGAVVELLDAVDVLLDDPSFSLELMIEPGDGLVVDNRVVLHNRSAYADDASHQRCLVRMWAA